jgi:hypothetical protein
MKMTEKGQRWGDVIRKELQNPKSLTSLSVRQFKAYKKLCDTCPKDFKLELDVLGNIVVNMRGDRQAISYMPDVGYLFR